MVKVNNFNNLPPGFRFHPTDEELIMYYLRNQATSRSCPVSIIPEVDIYKFDPWELPEKTEFGEKEWYFFSPRDRKYPNGVRPNRAAVSGYWKATGTDKSIYSGSKYVGIKKALVFYIGKPPKGIKTDWIMHEYRLSESILQPKQNHSMRLDDVVLCRIYKKKSTMLRTCEPRVEDSFTQIVTITNSEANELQPQKFPRPCSLNNLWGFDYMGSISQFLDANYSNNMTFMNQDTLMGSFSQADEKYQSGQVQQQNVHNVKFQVNQTLFVTPTYEF